MIRLMFGVLLVIWGFQSFNPEEGERRHILPCLQVFFGSAVVGLILMSFIFNGVTLW